MEVLKILKVEGATAETFDAFVVTFLTAEKAMPVKPWNQTLVFRNIGGNPWFEVVLLKLTPTESAKLCTQHYMDTRAEEYFRTPSVVVNVSVGQGDTMVSF